MKKTFILFSFLVGFWGLSAQNTILNSDFELWSYGKPVGWTVGLHGTITSIVSLPVEVNFGSQSSDAHGGNSAVRLASADLTIPYTTYSFNLPGILQAGESEGFSIPLENVLSIISVLQDTTGFGGLDSSDMASLSTFSQLLSNGVPCSIVPTSVNAWVKYQPQEGDQMMMFAVAKKDGMIVSYGSDVFQTENPNVYQKIGLALDNPLTECDSIMIIILSSTQLNSSSVLYVDDISLDFNGSGISDPSLSPAEIFPNPTNGLLHIQPDNDKTYEWALTDMSGKRLLTGKSQGESVIDTKTCAPGMYMLTIREGGKTSTQKVMIR